MPPRKRAAAAEADAEPIPKRRSSRQAASAAPRPSSPPATKKQVKPYVPAKKSQKAKEPALSKAKVTKKSAEEDEDDVASSRSVSPDPDPALMPAHNPDAVRREGKWYWLLKAEPETRLEGGVDVRFSIDDLRARTKPEGWDGIRSYAARNNLRAMNAGDMAFFYHSNCKTPGIVGTMEIVREYSEDKSARRKGAPYYDPQSSRHNVRWSLVHVEFRRKFAVPIYLPELREMGKAGGPLEAMQLVKQSRLSVSKVSEEEWKVLCELADVKAKEAGLEHEDK